MKYLPWGLLALLAIAFFAWGFPAFKSVTKERDELKTENQTLKSHTHETIVKVPVYIRGKIAYRTTLTRDNVTTDNRVSVDKTKDYTQTVTKRGMFTMMAYIDLKAELAGSASYSVLGPINVGAGFAGGQPYIGVGVSF